MSFLLVVSGVYVACSIGFMTFKNLTMLADVKRRKALEENPPSVMLEYDPFISIIIPVYNESTLDLRKCVISCVDNDYAKKEVLVVDDGSTLPTVKTDLRQLKKEYPSIKLKLLPKNVGKREAMYGAIMKSKGSVLVVVDSDSICKDGESLRELVKPLYDIGVDAVSGNTYAANENTNAITRGQAGRYSLAFEMEKAGQSAYGGVTCCPGCYSAYRKSAVMSVLDKWRDHSVFGVKTSYGDDRSLTRMVLLNGGRVVYASKATAYTNVPDTLIGFIRQQIRWKRSFFSEHFLLARGWSKLTGMMKLELVWFLFVWCGGLLAKALVLIYLLTGHVDLVTGVGLYLAFSIVHYTYVLLRYPGVRGLWGALYGFVNDLCFEWLAFYSVCTLKETSWGTR